MGRNALNNSKAVGGELLRPHGKTVHLREGYSLLDVSDLRENLRLFNLSWLTPVKCKIIIVRDFPGRDKFLLLTFIKTERKAFGFSSES